jgi:hypothetical protein
MSKVKVAANLLLIGWLAISGRVPASAQGCQLSGTPAWNSMLHNVIASCSDEFASPDGQLVLKISAESTISLSAKSGQNRLLWRGLTLVPPAMISWSPQSSAFFLNDGDGSGMSSSFRFFRIEGSTITEDKSIEQAAVSLYRRRTHCSSSAADPNVWGFGWDKHGGKVFLLVQPTVNESCGRPDKWTGLVVQTSDGKIVQYLSKAQTKERFGSQLPSFLFGESSPK